jgi:hypothetical protein
MIHTDILAVRVERRRIAVASFCGTTLDFADVRELSASPHTAASSTRTYLAWAIDTFKPAAVAVERPTARAGTQREHLANVAFATFFGKSVYRVFIQPQSVREALGEPPLRNRRELHEVGRALWPRLPGTRNPAAYDAALLGLHFQMLDLFMS